MQTVPQHASTSLPGSKPDTLRARPAEDVVYQVVTVGAILLVLGSLWVF